MVGPLLSVSVFHTIPSIPVYCGLTSRMYRLQSVSLVIDYLEHSLIAADWVLPFMTIVRMCAVAGLIFGFDFPAAFFALKGGHFDHLETRLGFQHKGSCSIGANFARIVFSFQSEFSSHHHNIPVLE